MKKLILVAALFASFGVLAGTNPAIVYLSSDQPAFAANGAPMHHCFYSLPNTPQGQHIVDVLYPSYCPTSLTIYASN